MRALEAISTLIRRHTAFSDIYAVPFEQQQEVAQMVNSAIVEVFALGPDRFRHTTATQAIGSTVAVTGLAIANGDTESTNTGVFSAVYRGQTILLSGDDAYNEVAGTASVLYPYAGSATCTAGTIYLDAMTFFDFSVDRIVSEVWCQRGSNGRRWPLVRDDSSWWASTAYSGIDPALANPWAPEFRRRTYQDPITYSVRAVGQSRNTDSDAAFVIRVDPIPTQAQTLIVEVDQSPAMLTIEGILDGAILPMPDARANAYFTALLADHFRESSLWASDKDRAEAVRIRAERARRSLEDLPQYFAPPVMTCGLAPGF